MPLDYSKTYIYKLCCRDVDVTDVYVGSTTNFTQRRREHRSRCENESGKMYNSNPYSFIREHGGWSNWDMVLVNTVNASSKLEAHRAEREHIESLRAALNKQTPGITRSESDKKYLQSHKDTIKEAKRVYIDANKEKIREVTRAYAEANKDTIKEYQASYRAANQEKIRQRKKQWRQMRKQAGACDAKLEGQTAQCDFKEEAET